MSREIELRNQIVKLLNDQYAAHLAGDFDRARLLGLQLQATRKALHEAQRNVRQVSE